MLVVLPFWTSFLIRIYAWINILQREGLLNQALLALHLVDAPVTWLAVGLMLVGTLMAAFAMLNGSASVLYTFYPPMKASPLFYIGATLLVVGSWVPYFQWIPVYLGWRRAHPGRKTPLAVTRQASLRGGAG